ncbi:MAG: hypothetical protein RIC51_05660 [Erythrobacter sp.]|uniref:hypothetical protein n=1 Tax=Erythrobacter sp. TaxID=1042 RepID=UPI0032EE2774
MKRFPLVAALAAAIAAAAPASAELLVAPTRLVLSPQQRSGELVLVNKGDEAAAFRLSVENRRMRDDGSLEAAEEAQPGELFADDKIRFSPRQLVLQPGARQTVRILASTPSSLPEGEYRSHLRLMSAPISAARPDADAGRDPEDNSLSIQLVAIRSITVPIILRKGSLDASVTVDAAALSGDATNQFILRMAREGDRSTYGDLRFFVEGEDEPAWMVRGVAIYTPNTSRDVVLAMPEEVTQRLSGKRVRIAYVATDRSDPATLGDLIAELTVDL